MAGEQSEAMPAVNRIGAAVMAALLIGLAVLICFWNPNGSPFFAYPRTKQIDQGGELYGAHIDRIDPSDQLGKALSGASMANKTLIISVLNKAYANHNSMLDLFFQSFKLGENTTFLLNHLLLVAVDQASYDMCNQLHRHCYKLVTEGVDFSKEVIYMSEDFINMMWRRTSFLVEVLVRGYNFIFTDMDVMWLRDPFPKLSHNGEDLQMSCDFYNGRPFDSRNNLNTGFYFVLSNSKTIALYKEWYDMRTKAKGEKEQDVMYDLRGDGAFCRLGLKVRYLDPRYFASFCSNDGTFEEARVIHASCCRTMKAKFVDLSVVVKEWRRYVNGTREALKWPQKKQCVASWK